VSGETPVTVKGISMTTTEGSIGMIPNSSVTIGSHEPATGTIVHVIVVSS